MIHSSLPPNVLEKEGLRIKDERAMAEQSNGVNIEVEENHLVQEMLTEMLDNCDTITLNPNNSETEKELAQISEDLKEMIAYGFN